MFLTYIVIIATTAVVCHGEEQCTRDDDSGCKTPCGNAMGEQWWGWGDECCVLPNGLFERFNGRKCDECPVCCQLPPFRHLQTKVRTLSVEISPKGQPGYCDLYSTDGWECRCHDIETKEECCNLKPAILKDGTKCTMCGWTYDKNDGTGYCAQRSQWGSDYCDNDECRSQWGSDYYDNDCQWYSSGSDYCDNDCDLFKTKEDCCNSVTCGWNDSQGFCRAAPDLDDLSMYRKNDCKLLSRGGGRNSAHFMTNYEHLHVNLLLLSMAVCLLSFV